MSVSDSFSESVTSGSEYCPSEEEYAQSDTSCITSSSVNSIQNSKSNLQKHIKNDNQKKPSSNSDISVTDFAKDSDDENIGSKKSYPRKKQQNIIESDSSTVSSSLDEMNSNGSSLNRKKKSKGDLQKHVKHQNQKKSDLNLNISVTDFAKDSDDENIGSKKSYPRKKQQSIMESESSTVSSSIDERNPRNSSLNRKKKSKSDVLEPVEKHNESKSSSKFDLLENDLENDSDLSNQSVAPRKFHRGKKRKNIIGRDTDVSTDSSSTDSIRNSKRTVKKLETTHENKQYPLNNSQESNEQSSFNISLDINLKSVGPVMKNKKFEVVRSSKDGPKKNTCVFCLQEKISTGDEDKKIRFSKLPEHLEDSHKSEKIVKKLIKLKEKLKKEKEQRGNDPKKSKKERKGKGSKKSPPIPLSETAKKRNKILDILRLQANHITSLQAQNVEEFVPSRRPNPKFVRTVDYFAVCYKCKKRLAKSSIHKHVAKCTKQSFKKKRCVQARSRVTTGDYHESAQEMAIKIISVMRNEELVNEIRYDKAVFDWLNAQGTRYAVVSSHYNHEKVRASLSRLARLLIEIKKINGNIHELSDILHENYYEHFIAAVTIMGRPHPETGFMQAPATANDMFNLIKKVAKTHHVNLGAHNQEKRIEIDNFLRKLNDSWHNSIGSTIALTQAENLRHKKEELPEISDIQCLQKYLIDHIEISFTALKKNYSDEHYEKFRNALLSFIQSSNCRRPGEVGRMELADYEHKQFDGNDCRIELRGKRSRVVPVVFEKKYYTYLEFLVGLRTHAKIDKDNPFVFANIGDVLTELNNKRTHNTYSCPNASKLLKEFAQHCGADKPENLKATDMRKQLATDQRERGIDNHGVEGLSKFMGHTTLIHRQNYRKSRIQSDIAISRKVKQSQGYLTDPPNEDLQNIEAAPNVDNNGMYRTDKNSHQNMHTIDESHQEQDGFNQNYEEYLEDSSAIQNINNKNSHKKSSREKQTAEPCMDSQPEKAPKKKQWLQESVDLLLAHFPNALNRAYPVPSAKKINDFLQTTNNPLMKKRTEPQVRSWIWTQRKKTKNSEKSPQRNHVPDYIYSKFQRYIEAKKLPGHETCAKFLAKSPSRKNMSIQTIQDWVKVAIKRNSL